MSRFGAFAHDGALYDLVRRTLPVPAFSADDPRSLLLAERVTIEEDGLPSMTGDITRWKASLALLGALVSLYVPFDAYRNGLNAGYPTPPVFLVLGVVFAAAGLAAGALTWRGHRLGLWLLLAAALGGLAAWPWLVAGMTYLLAAIMSVISLTIARRTVAVPRS